MNIFSFSYLQVFSILDTISSILIYYLPRYFLPSFDSIGLSVQEKKGKKRSFKVAAMAAFLDFLSKRF